MGRTRYKIYEEVYPYFITSSIRFGLPIFSIPEAAQILLDALLFLQQKRSSELYAYVIMENHIHLILEGESLPKKIASFKSYTARRIIDHLAANGHYRILRRLRKVKRPAKTDRDYQLWEEGYHPKQIVGDKMMLQKMEYIHNNPVKRGYVVKPEYWRYSSASNYSGDEGLIPITMWEDYCS